MNKFKEYVKKLIEAKTLSEYPVKKDTVYTVSFIQPELNCTEGMHRVLIPSFSLNEKTTVRALSVGISSYMNTISINHKDYIIKKDLAEISDHIVFPFTSLPLDQAINDLRKHNKKLKFSYYIDYNYYYTPNSYPFVNEFSGAEAIDIIEKNITLVDQVIVTNKYLHQFLLKELSEKEHIKGCKTNIDYQPLYFDRSLFPVAYPKDKKQNKNVRFGMVLNQNHFSDISFISGILKDFIKNNPKVELVILGWDGVYKGKNYLNNINAEIHKPVPFYDYYNKLQSLSIDCFIIPARSNKFNNTSKNIIKFYEFSRLGVPVIAPNIDPYKEIAKHNDNAVLCSTKEEWKFELETFLKDPDKYDGLKDRAYTSITDHEISDEDNLQKLLDIYEI